MKIPEIGENSEIGNLSHNPESNFSLQKQIFCDNLESLSSSECDTSSNISDSDNLDDDLQTERVSLIERLLWLIPKQS